MRHFSFLLVLFFLLRCENASIEPPTIVVDAGQLAPEAYAAIQAQQQNASRHPEAAQSWRELGMLYQAHGLDEAAILIYEYVGGISDDSQAIYLQATAHARVGNYDEAIKLASQLSDYIPATWKQGVWLMDQGRLADAAIKFQEVISRDPSAVAAIVGLARVRITQNKPELAITLLENIRTRGGSHPYLTFLLGTAHQRAGNQSIASTLLVGTAPGPPKWEDPWSDQMMAMQRGFAASLTRATTKIGEGDLQGALSILLSISKSHPRDTAVHNNLATVYMQLGQLDKANEILVKSIRRASDYAPTHLTMAMVLQRQGDPARAIVYAKRAVELQPAMSAAHALLGRLALQQGDLVASSAYFEESLSIGNSDPSTREVYAMVLLDLRETREALTQFGLVLQVNPSRTISIGGFAVATARLGNVQGALGILQEALKSAPTDTNLQRAMNTVQQLGTTP